MIGVTDSTMTNILEKRTESPTQNQYFWVLVRKHNHCSCLLAPNSLDPTYKPPSTFAHKEEDETEKKRKDWN